MISADGLHALSETLGRLQEGNYGSSVLDDAARTLQSAVKARLSHVPGEQHDAPWLRTGALRDSISVDVGADEAVIGSNDPAAQAQELGTRSDPPRPFFAPVAAELAPSMVSLVANKLAALLRGAVG